MQKLRGLKFTSPPSLSDQGGHGEYVQSGKHKGCKII